MQNQPGQVALEVVGQPVATLAVSVGPPRRSTTTTTLHLSRGTERICAACVEISRYFAGFKSFHVCAALVETLPYENQNVTLTCSLLKYFIFLQFECGLSECISW